MAPRTRRPGNSVRSNRKASGMPISAARSTEAAEIHKLRQSASHSSGRWMNSPNQWSVHPFDPPNASSRVISSG